MVSRFRFAPRWKSPLRRWPEMGDGSQKSYRQLLRYFRKDIRKRRRTLIGGASFGLLYALARVAEPWPLKVVFDQVLFRKPAHGVTRTIYTPFGQSPYAHLIAT